MKKVFCILLCFLLGLSLSIFIVCAESCDGIVKISSVTTKPGQTIELFVSIDCDEGVKTLSLLDFYYDHNVLGLVKEECSWLIDGKLKDIDFNNNASIITFDGNTLLSGKVLKLVFTVSKSVSLDDVSVTCDVVATQINDGIEEKINLNVIPGIISITRDCKHSGGEATCKKKAICSQCGESYGNLDIDNHKNIVKIKAEEATCSKSGKTEGKKCEDCGAEIIKQKTISPTGKHTYNTTITKATLTKNGKVESECVVCGKIKLSTIYYPKTINISKSSYIYNGKIQTPSITVKDSRDNSLTKDTDYTIKYESGRKVPGTYTVLITFKGKYSGAKKLYYTIAPKAISTISASQTTSTITLKWSEVTGADGYRVYKYNTSTKKYEKLIDVKEPSFNVGKLKAGTAYNYKIRAYTKDNDVIWGVYSQVIETSTKCKKPSITKITTTKGKASLVWSNVSGESGYQVYYSTKSESGYKKVASYKTNIVKCSKSKLTSGKKYYFKVRAYKKTPCGTVYSSWSNIKSIKIK